MPLRFQSLFATSMPPETVYRVWDAMFNEGPKVSLRSRCCTSSWLFCVFGSTSMCCISFRPVVGCATHGMWAWTVFIALLGAVSSAGLLPSDKADGLGDLSAPPPPRPCGTNHWIGTMEEMTCVLDLRQSLRPRPDPQTPHADPPPTSSRCCSAWRSLF
jgi:hypothetical protein